MNRQWVGVVANADAGGNAGHIQIPAVYPCMPFQFDNSYARLPDGFFAPIDPTPVSDPTLIALNRDLVAMLGIDGDELDSPEGLAILSGNQVAPGSEPIATAYAGHQFGGFSPQLGDGRAILIGEVIGTDGLRYDIQLKGSGPTPFSRRGDGRSALGPVLREYIISEAMAALGVPTTRALAAVASGEQVRRESLEPGGVFTRVARSHIRIGTFQWFAARNDQRNLQRLADYVIDRHYPELRDQTQPYRGLLGMVIAKQAELIAHWMQLGFIHGVMNTDNMNVSGETIDYGPCAFMDAYHPAKTFSSIDHQGRYAYGNQGAIGLWNLTRFAETLLPLLNENEDQSVEIAKAELDRYADLHQQALERRLLAKIGVESGDADDWTLIERLLSAMASGEADFTLTFRHLSRALETGDDQSVVAQFNQSELILPWLADWRDRLEPDQRTAAITRMRDSNPIYIPRNHRVEEAIRAGYNGDFEPFRRLNRLLCQPFTEQPDWGDYERAPQSHEVVQATFCGT